LLNTLVFSGQGGCFVKSLKWHRSSIIGGCWVLKERKYIMKFKKAIEVDDFFNTANECDGAVWLESPYGDKYMLKSLFSNYLALAALLSEHGDELELYCQFPEDRVKFYKYFYEHPGVN
jgi:hypothetical protein